MLSPFRVDYCMRSVHKKKEKKKTGKNYSDILKTLNTSEIKTCC